MKRLFLILTLASLVTAAAIGIGILLIGDFGDTQLKLLFTTLAIGGFSLIGSVSASSRGTLMLPIRILGIAACLAALAVVAPHIWELVAFDDRSWKLMAVTTVLAVSFEHLSLLSSFRVPNVLTGLWRAGAMVLAIALAALIIAGVLGLFDTGAKEVYARAVGAVAILDVLGTVSLAPLSRLAGARRSSATPRQPAGVKLGARSGARRRRRMAARR